jgi:hypothetical protein
LRPWQPAQAAKDLKACLELQDHQDQKVPKALPVKKGQVVQLVHKASLAQVPQELSMWAAQPAVGAIRILTIRLYNPATPGN